MTKYLIVNSDDYGISAGVSRGIIEANLSGIVSSTTVMANMPAAIETVPKAIHEAPNLGLGLHLVLSYGKPVSAPEAVPSLVTSEGTFAQNWDGLSEKIADFNAEELEAEFNAQFDQFVTIAGKKPDHIDCHHHAAYFHPGGYEALLKLADKHNLPIRRSGIEVGVISPELPTNADGKLHKKLLALEKKYSHIVTPDYMNQIFFWDRRSRVEPFKQAIEALQDGYTELICHVGYAENLEEDFNVQREDDLAAVLDESIISLVKDSDDIELVTFADIPKNPSK